MLVLATKWEEEVFDVENITEINLQIIKARALKNIFLPKLYHSS